MDAVASEISLVERSRRCAIHIFTQTRVLKVTFGLSVLFAVGEELNKKQHRKHEHHRRTKHHEHILHKAGNNIPDCADRSDSHRIRQLCGNVIYMVALSAR